MGLARTFLRRSPRRVLHVLRHPNRLRQWAEVWRDYAAFQRTYRFLSEGRRLEQPDRRLLIVNLSNWVAEAKIEAMLATALRLHGWSVSVLTSPTCGVTQPYFRACGLDRFVDFDAGYPKDLSGSNSSETARELLASCRSAQEALDLRYQDVHVGRHALSAWVSDVRCGHIEFDDPHIHSQLEKFVARSVEAVEKAERVIARAEPQLMLFLEKGYTPFGELFDVAVNHAIPVIQWVHSHRSDALALKRYGSHNRHLHPFSLSQDTWRAVQAMPWTADQERELFEELEGRYQQGSWFDRKFLHVEKRIKDAATVRQQLGLDPGKKTAVIFSHVLWDATFFYGETLFEDYEEWLIETVKAACENPTVNWVVKLHPDYMWKLKRVGSVEVRDRVALGQAIARLPDHVRLLEPDTNISTFSLFGLTDYCLTVRGTIGIEMACYGIPVLTAGTGRYAGLGFTIDSPTKAEYLERLRTIQDIPRLSAEQTELARRHAYVLLKRRPMPFQTFEMVHLPLERLGGPLDHNTVIRARSLEDLIAAEDLRIFADWVTETDQDDLLVAGNGKLWVLDREPAHAAAPDTLAEA